MSIIGGNNTIDPPVGGGSGGQFDCDQAFEDWTRGWTTVDEILKSLKDEFETRSLYGHIDWLWFIGNIFNIKWLYGDPLRGLGVDERHILPIWDLVEDDLWSLEKYQRYAEDKNGEHYWYGKWKSERQPFLANRKFIYRLRGVYKHRIKDKRDKPIWTIEQEKLFNRVISENANQPGKPAVFENGRFFDEYYRIAISCIRLYSTQDEINLKKLQATFDAFFDAMDDAAKDGYFWLFDVTGKFKDCKCLPYDEFVRRYLIPQLQKERTIPFPMPRRPDDVPLDEEQGPEEDGSGPDTPTQVTPHGIDDPIPFLPDIGIPDVGSGSTVKNLARKLYEKYLKGNLCQRKCTENKLYNP